MANFEALKTLIRQYIKENGDGEITGDILQSVLIAMVTEVEGNGYVYAGIATPTTVPVTGNVFYIATEAGSYSNFGSVDVSAGITILKRDGTSWTKNQISYTDGVFDISAYNGSSYADLADALGTNGANVPVDVRKGGMSIKFVTTSDNKYVQYLYHGTSTDITDFTNIANWEKTNLWEEVEPMLHHIEYEELTASQTVADKRMGTNGNISDLSGYDLLYFNVVVGKRYKITVAQNTLNQYSTVFAYYRDATRIYLPTTGAKSCPVSNYEKVITAEYTQLIVSFDHGTSCKVYEEIEVPSIASRVENLEISTVKNTDIVDNLTTDDSSKPLSAKQGKVLAQGLSSAMEEIDEAANDITDIQSALEDITSTEYEYIENGDIDSNYSGGSVIFGRGNVIAANTTIYKVVINCGNGNTASPITKIKMRLLKTNWGGEVLATKVVDFAFTDNNYHNVEFDFSDSPITYSGNIYCTVQFDNQFAISIINAADYTYGTSLIYTTSSDLENPASWSIDSGSVKAIYANIAYEKVYNVDVTTDDIENEAITEEKLSQEVQEKLNAPTEHIGDLGDLSTEDKTSLVNAINEVNNHLHTHSREVINTLTNIATATKAYLPNNQTIENQYILAYNAASEYMSVAYIPIVAGRKYTIKVTTGNQYTRVLAYSNVTYDGELSQTIILSGKALDYIGSSERITLVIDSAQDYPYMAICYDSRYTSPTVTEEYTEVIKGLIEQTTENTEDIGDISNLSTEDKTSLVSAINEVNNKTEVVDVILPDRIYAVVGDTLQIFYRGCVKVVNPYNYNILVTCEKGNQYPRFFQYLPTVSDIGTTSFKLTVKDNSGKKLGEKTCSLVTVSSGSSPSAQKNIVVFGDSATAGGQWCAEAYRRLTGTGGTPSGKGFNNISFVGKYHGGTDAGFFAKGGWDWSGYTTAGRQAYRFQVTGVTSLSVGAVYTNNGVSLTILEVNVTEGTGNILCSYSGSGTPQVSGVLTKTSGSGDSTITYSSYEQETQNPLWDEQNNKMTFIPYANAYCNGQIDVVMVLLGGNGITPWRKNFNNIKADMRVFADTLHTEFPNAKLKVLGMYINSVNGGMGANYGATGTSYADAYGIEVTLFNEAKAYQEFANEDEYSDFVEYIGVSSQFDSEYNMPYSEFPVNTRSTTMERRDTNGLHPSNDGYKQIADVVYRSLTKEICQ